jgi:hypothetical protein
VAADDESPETDENTRSEARAARTRINADADERDVRADARDEVSNDRDMSDTLDSFVRGADDGVAREARRLASRDRSQSKEDRRAAASDRSELSVDPVDDDPDTDGPDVSSRRRPGR